MNEMDYRNYRGEGNYRDDENYRDYRDYRDDYRNYRDYRDYRDYDRRGGRINRRNYRNYRNEDYYEELHMIAEDMREGHRRIEDVAEMADNQQDKSMLIKIAQKEKENYTYLKQLMDK